VSRRPSAAGGDQLRFMEFQLPTLVERPPEGNDWIHEIKWDGYCYEGVRLACEVDIAPLNRGLRRAQTLPEC
jgi:hypothetical protein